MRRRSFIKATGLSAFYLIPDILKAAGKTHLISLSFDDGFKKSFYRIAEIHEEYGLKACLNVIASGHLPSFKGVDEWILPELMVDFNDWNKLKSQGHEIMPHTWEHLNLTKIPLAQAKENMDKCFAYFEENLDDYNADRAIYNFAFNASTTELEDYALKNVLAVRTAGWVILKDNKFNPLQSGLRRLGCWSYGPDNCDLKIDHEINDFLQSEGGWLILNLHGVDGEGWGPVSTSYLDKLLKKLAQIETLSLSPVGATLANLK